MKFVNIILISIIFFGSAYPCADAESILFYENIVTSNMASDHNEAVDNCSPFCICSCCSISYSIEKPIAFNYLLYSPQNCIIFQNNYLFNYISPIWQPPKA